MPDLLTDCERYFGTRDLYEVLHIESTAIQAEVKKAYKRLSLLTHPDKVQGSDDDKEVAKCKFQTLSKVYYILSDSERRTIYDDTGEVDDEDVFSSDRDWEEYWRLLFPRVTVNDIEKFMKKYRGSEDELEDIKAGYLKCEGDMNLMCEYLIGFNAEDEDRYVGILNDLIQKEEVPAFDKFINETEESKNKRKKWFENEASEAKGLRNGEGSSDDSLVKAIRGRSAAREAAFNSLISSLEAKYSDAGETSRPKKQRSKRK